MLEVTVALKVEKEGVESLRALGEASSRDRRRTADVREAKRLLGLVDPAGEAYRSDAVHPLYTPGQIHPDNKAALRHAGSDALALNPIARDDLRVQATDSSLLLFGSPTSEGLSRVMFGYSEVAGREGLSWDDPPLDLAYAWELDPERVGDAQVGRFVPGKGLVERPPWQIKDLRSGHSGRLVPETDAAGLIQEDYLLITRTRNFFSPEALNRGQFLVSFGGAHGTGTRAVGLLFEDRRLMQEVLAQLKARHAQSTGRLGGVPKAYQLLFRVSGIKHGEAGSIPSALELIDVAVLRDDLATWDFAHGQAAPRLKAPRAEQ